MRVSRISLASVSLCIRRPSQRLRCSHAPYAKELAKALFHERYVRQTKQGQHRIPFPISCFPGFPWSLFGK
ncbi:hypothetical protein AKJ16_DCAP22116 [Drosera capensis]